MTLSWDTKRDSVTRKPGDGVGVAAVLQLDVPLDLAVWVARGVAVVDCQHDGGAGHKHVVVAWGADRHGKELVRGLVDDLN